jgi:transcriptional regulator with XRE-family HTH domain
MCPGHHGRRVAPLTVTTADRQALAANLRRLRQSAVLTQQQLATSAGLSRQEISRLENAHQWPTTLTLLFLSHALRVSPHTLLEGTFWNRPRTHPEDPE